MGVAAKQTLTKSQRPWLRVRNSRRERIVAYFSKISKNYEGFVNWKFLSYFRDRERNTVIRMLALDSGSTLLDVGVGAGFFSRIAKAKGLTTCGVDVVPGMLEAAKPHLNESKVVSVEKLDYKNRFDRIVCAGVLDFTRSPMTAIARMSDAMVSGGRLVILCPRRGPGGVYYIFEKMIFGMRVNLLTREVLTRWAERAGLTYIEHAHPLPTNMAITFEKR